MTLSHDNEVDFSNDCSRILAGLIIMIITGIELFILINKDPTISRWSLVYSTYTAT